MARVEVHVDDASASAESAEDMVANARRRAVRAELEILFGPRRSLTTAEMLDFLTDVTEYTAATLLAWLVEDDLLIPSSDGSEYFLPGRLELVADPAEPLAETAPDPADYQVTVPLPDPTALAAAPAPEPLAPSITESDGAAPPEPDQGAKRRRRVGRTASVIAPPLVDEPPAEHLRQFENPPSRPDPPFTDRERVCALYVLKHLAASGVLSHGLAMPILLEMMAVLEGIVPEEVRPVVARLFIRGHLRREISNPKHSRMFLREDFPAATEAEHQQLAILTIIRGLQEPYDSVPNPMLVAE